jgi:chitodextrinase
MAHLMNGTNAYGFGDNLTIPLQVINASSVSRYQIPEGLDQARPGPGLNVQVSGSEQVFRTLPAGLPSLQPVTDQVQSSPATTPREARSPVISAVTLKAIPAGSSTTPSVVPSPVPVAARTLRTDVAIIRFLPVASFTVTPTVGIAPLSVTCDASASRAGQGSITSSAWNFGDGTTGSDTAVTHVYTRAGNYTITLVVTDSASQTATISHPVNVSAPATVAVIHIINEKPAVHILQPTK